MQYVGLFSRQGIKDPSAKFFHLLRQERYDAALALSVKTVLGDEVFTDERTQSAGILAIELALRIGNPGDAEKMREGFRISPDAYTDPIIVDAIRGKLRFYTSAGYQEGIAIINALYLPKAARS